VLYVFKINQERGNAVAIKQKEFRFVCIRHTMVFAEEDYDEVRKIVESAKPDYWHYLDPDIIYAYFIETEKNAASADKLINELRILFKLDHRYYGVGVGMLVAEMSADIGFWGKIKAPPAGVAAEEVSRLAYEDAVKNA
jgi:hypothetical protein